MSELRSFPVPCPLTLGLTPLPLAHGPWPIRLPMAHGPFREHGPRVYTPTRSGREPIVRRFPRNPMGVSPMSMTRRASAILFCVAAVFLASTSGHGKDEDSRTGSVWVVNRDRGELVVFDAKTGTVLTTRLCGGGRRARYLHLREGRQGLHRRGDDHTVTTVDTRTLDERLDPRQPAAASHRTEP